MDSVLSNEVARRIAADLTTLVSEAEKHGTLPRIKSVAIYFNETELRTIIKLLRSCHGILDPAQGHQQPIGVAEAMPGTTGFTMGVFGARTVPVGTKLYAAQPPAAPVETEPTAWIVLSEETGNTRIWWRDKERAEEWSRQHDKPLIPLYADPRVGNVLPLSRSSAETAREILKRNDDRPLPSYGQIPWKQLGRDVVDVQYAKREDYKFDPTYYEGHQMVPQINFNSLARIVDKYRWYGLLTTQPQPVVHSGTYLGYRDEHGNEMHCAHAFCPHQKKCRRGCACPVSRPEQS